VPPDPGADQDRVMLADVTADCVKLSGCPGATVAELPAAIEAKAIVPPEYVTHRTVPDWHGDSPLDPFDVTMLPENATAPGQALIISHEKPDAKPAVWAEIRIGALQTRIELLCTAALSVVLVLSSNTRRVQPGSFPETHGHSVPNV
jgi:hypothetical protein